LAGFIKERTGIVVDPQSLFDIQVKRLHEYKRQHLNALYAITLYNQLKRGSVTAVTPRTVIFGGKAAPGYRMAKLIIAIDQVRCHGHQSRSENFRGTQSGFSAGLQRQKRPACLSRRRSFRTDLNGGQRGLGHRQYEIRHERGVDHRHVRRGQRRDPRAVGDENFFLFGLTAEEVVKAKADGYNPRSVCEANPELREVIDLVDSGCFSNGDRELFRPITESLLHRDDYMLLADYQAYVDCQQRVSEAYRNQKNWTRMSILNSARVGRFSSDRSIRDYCRDIWNVSPIKSEPEIAPPRRGAR
jgi:starch phosphorylase